jgi:8-oxo-dGTP diphosphatase
MTTDVSALCPRRRDSAFAVIVRRSLVLLVRARRKRRWQLPGGRLERRESAREAARREVGEETGIEARILDRTGVYLRSDGSRAVVFAACVPDDAEPAGPRHEIDEQRWVPRDEALRLLPRRARRRLADALAVCA